MASSNIPQRGDVVIRPFVDGDLEGVARCFTESVRVIAARYYDPEQIEAWAPVEADLAFWRERLSGDGVLVARAGGRIAGFVRAERSGLIDLLYVHPAHERRGIGRALLDRACAWASAMGAQRLEADVSLAARPLFEAAGFRVDQERHVAHRGVMFRNFRMVRQETP